MIGISIERFAKLFIKNNTGEKYEDVVKKLKVTLKRKNEGARCQVCGQPIWQPEVQLAVLIDVLLALPVKAMILVIMKYIKKSN